MNPIVHFEIMAGPGQDKQKLQQFYARTFDWKVDADNEFNYGMVDPGASKTGERGIAGAIDDSEDGPAVIIYVEVDDPQKYLDRAVANGGTQIMPVTVIPGAVTMAQFKDPSGNLMGIVAASTPPGE